METVAQGRYAYVANGTGMAVVDWENPGRPQTVAVADLNDELADPTLSVKDVKVDGDVAALANDTENPGGIALYDVSDPTNPEYQSFYEPTPSANIHNCHLVGDYAYLALGEPWNIDTDGDGQRDLARLFGDAGVEIVDVSDPANPTHASTWYLKDELPAYAKAGVNPCHDLYAQDGLVYAAFWDAGTVVLDASDPTDPEFVTQFGAAPRGDEVIRPWRVEEETIDEYFAEVFPLARYYAAPGNAHYVQPSPDGDHVYVGAETFLGGPGGIDVWDVSDFSAPTQVGRIDPPNVSGFRTSHNFDVTENRLHASWYEGGVRVYDVTDPSTPTEVASYDPDGVSFWTAVAERGFTLGGVYGAMSEQGGMTVLHTDEGVKEPPAFSGADSPSGPEVDPKDQS
ncbi:LVIVD repeat-containing protein [Halorussus caseinilyticus]|uniref:LVIVD repeat-containing protein n=2 Tax=Halorussus caseinilyticus TaxID=3034025 RepID=A0ABD5WKQ3_9EURY